MRKRAVRNEIKARAKRIRQRYAEDHHDMRKMSSKQASQEALKQLEYEELKYALSDKGVRPLVYREGHYLYLNCPFVEETKCAPRSPHAEWHGRPPPSLGPRTHQPLTSRAILHATSRRGNSNVICTGYV